MAFGLQKRLGVFPFLYLAGFWLCYLLQPRSDSNHSLEIEPVTNVVVPVVKPECSPPKPVVVPAPPSPQADNSINKPNALICKCDSVNRSGAVQSGQSIQSGKPKNFREAMKRYARPCEDDLAAQRTQPATSSMALARCAINWLKENAAEFLIGPPDESDILLEKPIGKNKEPAKPDNSKILFDYTYDGMEYPFPNLTTPEWVYLTALLPQAGLPLPPLQTVAPNQLLLAPPSFHRTNSLFVTNTLFDLQLALRFDEFLEAVKPMSFEDTISKVVGMARVTYAILPCDKQYEAESSIDIVKKAVRSVLANFRDMGLHQLDVQVRPVAVFQHQQCTRELLRIAPIKIHRGVRLKWCYYPLGTKYDLIYRKDDMVQLVHRYVMQWTRFGGDKVKTIRRWHPSINMGDVLGWGMDHAQREILFYDMLTQPSCPDPAIQNWLLTKGGRVLRIDPNQQSWKNKHPTGRQYVEFMKLFTCVERGGWKQKFDMAVQSSCMSCQGGNLIHVSEDGKWKFYNTQLRVRDKEGNFVPVEIPDAVEANEFPECPSCNHCVVHTFRSLKLFWHNEKSLPPPACTECYHCQRKLKLGKGVTTDVSQMHGCTDVEDVDADNPPPNPDYCYDTQMHPIPRPSAPPEVVKKGFFS